MNCRRISRIFSLVIILNLLALPVFSQVDQPAASTENPEATPIVKEESEGPVPENIKNWPAHPGVLGGSRPNCSRTF